jgi:hypothetical protein
MPLVNKAMWVLLGFSIMLSGCRSSSAVKALEPTVAETPNAPAQVETPQSSAGIMFRPVFGDPNKPTLTEQPPTTVSVVATPTVVAPGTLAPEYVEIAIYGDKVDPNWSLEHSDGFAYDPFDTTHWFSMLDTQSALDSGAVSLAVTPLKEFATLFFTVRPNTRVSYARDRVLGVSLWINSGSAIIDTDDLIITAVGSNELTYWSPDDYSVFPDSDRYFSETRFYDIGMNRAIPPDTWAQVILWLDDLLYDPMYSNVVGFYIKNDADFETTFYIDNVTLLMVP